LWIHCRRGLFVLVLIIATACPEAFMVNWDGCSIAARRGFSAIWGTNAMWGTSTTDNTESIGILINGKTKWSARRDRSRRLEYRDAVVPRSFSARNVNAIVAYPVAT